MLSALFCNSVALIPTPKRQTGVAWNNDAKDVVIEMYGDPLCPYCLMVWDTMMKVVKKYPNNVQFRLHLFALPYHTWAYAMTKFIVAARSISEEEARKLVNALYTGDQSKFDNGPMSTYTEPQVIDYMANYASEKLSIEKTRLMDEFKKSELNARIEFKFADSHSVVGTPTFFVNGAELDVQGDDFDEWCRIIDSLLN